MNLVNRFQDFGINYENPRPDFSVSAVGTRLTGTGGLPVLLPSKKQEQELFQ